MNTHPQQEAAQIKPRQEAAQSKPRQEAAPKKGWLQDELKKHARTKGQLFFVSDENRDSKLTFKEFSRGVGLMGVKASQVELLELFKAFGE